jgi:hypothetical protein
MDHVAFALTRMSRFVTEARLDVTWSIGRLEDQLRRADATMILNNRAWEKRQTGN